MGPKVKGLAGLWLIPILSLASLAVAAGPDVRLVTAAAEQDKAAGRTLLKQGVDVNAARADDATALLWAAHWDDLDTATLLLRAGANVNAADDHGVTALARAAENAGEPMVAKLLGAKANPKVAQTSGLTPLMIAARTGNVNVAKLLLAHGANINARNYRGRTPYRLAEGSKQSFQFQAYPETAEFIKKLGANIRLSISGSVHERVRDVGAAVGAANQP